MNACTSSLAGRERGGRSEGLSQDVRQRTGAGGQEGGRTDREAAARVKVSAARVSRWRALAAEGAAPMHGPLGGDRRSHVIEAQATTILEVFHARRDLTPLELRPDQAERGPHSSL